MDTPERIAEIETLFKEFLKEQGVKLAFEKEIKARAKEWKDANPGKPLPSGYYTSLKQYLERYAWFKFGAHRLVSHAFAFYLSEAGREFWLDIHNKWCKKIAR